MKLSEMCKCVVDFVTSKPTSTHHIFTYVSRGVTIKCVDVDVAMIKEHVIYDKYGIVPKTRRILKVRCTVSVVSDWMDLEENILFGTGI
jgi:hypothetical protein